MTAFACCVNARRQPARPATPAERPATPARHPRQGLDGSDLEPQLAHTLTFTRCAAVAERLLGRPVEHRFDHAIYKPAFNGAATSWHQDEAYALERKILSAHFWVPLQDVTRDMGCMQFIPGGRRRAARTRWSRGGQRFLKGESLASVEGAACGCGGFSGDVALRLSATVSS